MRLLELVRNGCILLLMSPVSTWGAQDAIEKIAQDPSCVRALSWIDRNAEWVTNWHIRLVEISAPGFGDAARGGLLKKLFAESDLEVHTDQIGNVIGERAGSDVQEVILLMAHLDTVFPAGTDVRVRRNANRLEAPGITDNGAGLAALVGVAQALSESQIRTRKTIVIAGDVGEEGLGGLRGARALIERYGQRLAAVIVVDGAGNRRITTRGVASRRFEVSVAGPGGHSWSDFGAANPITALARGIVRFSSISVPADPRTSYNFGVIQGGTAVNSIPAHAAVTVDLRSDEESELDRLETALREVMLASVQAENSAANPGSEALRISFRSLGVRPGGKLPENSPLLATIRSVDRFLDIRSRRESASTDANIPLSLGIPALALGGGGSGGDTHRLTEWYDATGRALGLKRLLLITLALAGVVP